MFPTKKMNNGVEIPVLGLGTYEMRREDVRQSVAWAMREGYRLYDTAQVYRNEKEVGEAIRALSGDTPRKDVFITTKVMTSNQGYSRCLESVKESLGVMGLDYLDLVLVHWPGAKGLDPRSPENKPLRHGSYRALLELQREGLVKSVGVSNFMKTHIEGLQEEFSERPQVNQIEISPLCHPKEAIRCCEQNGIVVQAYSSLGRSVLLRQEWADRVPVLKRLRERKDAQLSTLLLRWAVQNGFCIIPKSTHEERIIENTKVFEVEISQEDMEDLNNISVEKRTCWDPTVIL